MTFLAHEGDASARLHMQWQRDRCLRKKTDESHPTAGDALQISMPRTFSAVGRERLVSNIQYGAIQYGAFHGVARDIY